MSVVAALLPVPRYQAARRGSLRWECLAPLPAVVAVQVDLATTNAATAAALHTIDIDIA
jgi:hypothetical protein